MPTTSTVDLRGLANDELISKLREAKEEQTQERQRGPLSTHGGHDDHEAKVKSESDLDPQSERLACGRFAPMGFDLGLRFQAIFRGADEFRLLAHERLNDRFAIVDAHADAQPEQHG